jgi:hypothetical protein
VDAASPKQQSRSRGDSNLQHIRAKWGSYVQDMQAHACKNNGFALLHSRVLVDENGEPVFWMEPRLERIEPKRGASEFIAQVLGMLEPSNNS